MTTTDHLRAGWHITRLFNFRHLFGRPRRTLLTVAGIAASVSLVVAIAIINETLRGAIDGTMLGLAGGADLEVAPSTAEYLPTGSVSELRSTRGVQAVVPAMRQITLLHHRDAASRTIVFGVPMNLPVLFPQRLGDAARQITRANFQRGVLVSSALASSLDVGPGDRIVVSTPGHPVKLPVIGILGHNPFAAVNGGNFGILPLHLARRVFQQPRGSSVAYVLGSPDQPVPGLNRLIKRRLGHSVVVRSPGTGAEAYKRTYNSIAIVSEQTQLVALVVALFLVFNTMSMSLAERREELVLLALDGAQQPQILAAFVVEAAILGVVGSFVGVIGGAGLGSAIVQHAADSYGLLPLTVTGSITISPSAVALGFGTGVAVAIFGALLPAGRVLRVKPIDALRPEAAYEWGGKQMRRTGVVATLGLVLLAGVAGIAAFVPTDSRPWLLQIGFAVALVGAALLLPVIVPSLASALRRTWLFPFGMVGRLAGDTLLRNPRRTIIVAGGLALSASVVISVSTGLGSYDREVERAASMWYETPLFVSAPGSAVYISDQPLPDSLRRGLTGVPGVRAAYPSRVGLVDDGGRQLLIYAMPIAEAAAAGSQITSGVGISQLKLVQAMRNGEVVMSRLAARRRGLNIGDFLRLSSVSGTHRLRVASFFNDIVSADSMYMELSDYQRDTADDRANRFAIVLNPGAKIGWVAGNIRRYLRTHGISASVITRTQMRSEVLHTVEGLFSLARGIQVAALLLAGLIALNTMLTATFERRREFGLQRIIGMSRRQLAGSVMLESVTMSIIASAIAVALGLGVGLMMMLTIENQLAWRMSFTPDIASILGTLAATLLISCFAALYPSWRATRQRLVDLVGYE